MSELDSIGVVSVATNQYLDYWFDMAKSADLHLFQGHEVVLHVFTDRAKDAREMAKSLTRVKVDAVQIDALGWPEATLLRYEIFNSHQEHLREDLLLHLDADMLLVEDVGAELDPKQWNNGIALVRHPGFRRPSFWHRIALYLRKPRLAIADARLKALAGGLGGWESDHQSLAYVPRTLRKSYVCGGTWMGRHYELVSMIGELAKRTRTDLDSGVIAVWHDESHLNWYFSHHATTILGSEYCYAIGYPNITDLHARIIAVDKGNERTR
ncbi:MAG: hypothetical protein Q7L55_13000 [Actinomycetota bacterium]|nr:hypothetical protein [Actinomycetota bacterium]